MKLPRSRPTGLGYVYEVRFSSNSAAYCFPGHKCITKVMEVVKKMKMHRTGQEAKIKDDSVIRTLQERVSAKKMGIC